MLRFAVANEIRSDRASSATVHESGFSGLGITSDEENPEWTDADFKKARPASELPAEVHGAFPRTRGIQKAAKKVPVYIRLSREAVERFKADGPGWQTRIDDVSKKAVGL